LRQPEDFWLLFRLARKFSLYARCLDFSLFFYNRIASLNFLQHEFVAFDIKLLRDLVDIFAEALSERHILEIWLTCGARHADYILTAGPEGELGAVPAQLILRLLCATEAIKKVLVAVLGEVALHLEAATRLWHHSPRRV
jgi:hypothetical protein